MKIKGVLLPYPTRESCAYPKKKSELVDCLLVDGTSVQLFATYSGMFQAWLLVPTRRLTQEPCFMCKILSTTVIQESLSEWLIQVLWSLQLQHSFIFLVLHNLRYGWHLALEQTFVTLPLIKSATD